MSQAPSIPLKESVLDFVNAKSHRYADRRALCIKEGGDWKQITYGQMHDRAVRLASYLIEIGVEQGDRIVVLSESKPEWGVAFFAAMRSGAAVVPLDVKLTESELFNIMSDCNPRFVLADRKHLELADKVKQKVSSIEKVFCVDDGCDDATHPCIDSLQPKEIRHSRERLLDEVALIVYTSGTTGNPKGVMTTFGNLMFQINSFEGMVGLNEEDRYLSILPLNHLLELTGGFLGVLSQGGSICFCHSLFPQEIIRVMQERQITGMIAVPLFYRTLKGAIEREIKKEGESAWAQFELALKAAAALPMAARHKMFERIHDKFGGKLRGFISGGAPLDVDVAEFFDRLGLPILQGYGLTETSPVISGNSLHANRIGSVGKPLLGVEVKIDARDSSDNSGEILSRGPHIMKGYYRRDDLTEEVIDKDGWFHTGDIGHLDKDGFLYITGRIKNLIVLGGGKKVFPEEVESVLQHGETIKEICVAPRKSTEGFKEGTEEVCAVVVPADSLVAACKGDAAKVRQSVEQEIDKLNEKLAPYKRPARIFIYEGELPKTATRKVKRPLVVEWLNNQ